MPKYNIEGGTIIHPTIQDIERLFDEYNKLYFDNKLVKCDFGNTKVPSHFGAYEIKNKKITINLRKNILWTEADLKKTLIHEMIHYYVRINKMFSITSHFLSPFIFIMHKMNKKYNLGITVYSHILTKEMYKLGHRHSYHYNTAIGGAIKLFKK